MCRIIILCIVLLSIIFSKSFFIIPSGYRGIVVGYEKKINDNKYPENIIVYKPGMHYRVPFLDNLIKIDVRPRLTITKSNQFYTSDHKKILINYFIKWDIVDINRYLSIVRGNNPQKLESLLVSRINKQIHDLMSHDSFDELIHVSKNDLFHGLKFMFTAKSPQEIDTNFNQIDSNATPQDQDASTEDTATTSIEFNKIMKNLFGIRIVNIQITNVTLFKQDQKDNINQISIDRSLQDVSTVKHIKRNQENEKEKIK
ncbi:Modulator of FtsH protease HflC [Buchnera aphidicola (Thelaxes suberi)]|uniref:SPFH domain-containing protein n=1 Tax=Buchnera aphidicola TaxID=9 RepID=UPI003464DD89